MINEQKQRNNSKPFLKRIDHGEQFNIIDDDDKPAYTITIQEKSNFKVREYFIEEIQD